MIARTRTRPFDRTFVGIAAGLAVFGLVMLMSASGPLGYKNYGDSLYFLKHQLLYGVLPGVILFYVLSRIDYRLLRVLAFPSLVVSILLLVLVYVPGIGLHIGGSSRWVAFGPISFQPSEFVKVTFLIYMAAWMTGRRGDEMSSIERSLVPFLGALGMIMLLLAKQPNTGSMMVIAGSALLMYFVAGAPVGWFAGLGISSVALVALLIKYTPYRAQRFMTFLHPELDPKGIGYHINQAFLAIGSGGLFGLGYGHSRQKFLYLPEVEGDSIFAVMAEELGFFAVVAFLAVLATCIWRCFKIAQNAPDSFGMFLATGIGSWFALQSFFNIASMIGLMPMTGVTLPFVSYGSSACVAIAAGLGIVASISRQSKGQ